MTNCNTLHLVDIGMFILQLLHFQYIQQWFSTWTLDEDADDIGYIIMLLHDYII